MEDRFSKFLLFLGKLLIIGTIAPIILIGSGLGVYFMYKWHTYGRYVQYIPAMAENEEGSPRRLTCKEEQSPVYVGFENQSSRAVKHISIILDARVPGATHNILDYPNRVEFDRIVGPGEHSGACFSFKIHDTSLLAPDGPKPVYRAFIESVEFAD